MKENVMSRLKESQRGGVRRRGEGEDTIDRQEGGRVARKGARGVKRERERKQRRGLTQEGKGKEKGDPRKAE